MATFDADALGKRLEAINRDTLASIEREAEELLQRMQRKGPLRADASDAGSSVPLPESESVAAPMPAGRRR